MLFIHIGDKVKLPKKYHRLNNLSAHIYDLITEVFVRELYAPMKSTTIEFHDDKELAEEFLKAKSHALDALKKGNRDQDLEIILTKHITMSMISDMVNFIYESIDIAKKGKMSVAYSLLRKPFTDQLLLLEQLLVDRKTFIYDFFHIGDPKNYDPASRNIDKENVIERAIEKLNTVNVFYSKLIYESRYVKSYKGGINWITNQAIHIVTNDKNYATERQNLNFIFSNPEDTENYWNHFYSVVPYLLIYTSAIIDKIVFEFIDDVDDQKVRKDLKRFIAILMIFPESRSMFRLLGKVMKTQCSICNHSNVFGKKMFQLFFNENILLCKKCYNPLNLTDEVLSNLKNLFLQRNQ